ncbi:MAG TPA: hypothetical protein VEJ18_02585, partial [Planctomycetota bacterium]|nr:hypothetical protein [Planctomycetota bacterium]
MIVSGAEGIFLDRLGRRAVRYALDPAMFTAPPARVYGGKRRGPSAVREPIDLAVLPEGDVWILDAGEGTIRTFAEDGSYQTTVGSFQEPRAMRRGRSAAVHVVDAGARQVLTFEGGRMTRRTALPAEELPVDLLEPSQLLFADRWGNRPLSGARAVRLDGFGRIYVIEADGRAILRLASDGPDARRLASFPLEAQTVRALPDGGFALEDGRERLEFDAEGWLRRRGRPEGGPRRDRDAVGNPFGMSDDGGLRCGEKALDVGRLRVADFDLDPFGRVLLVEGGTGRVLRLGIARWAE